MTASKKRYIKRGKKLWSHQARATGRTWKLVAQGKNVLVVSPPGSGKSLMIAEFVRLALSEHRTLLILAHRWRLLDQIKEHLDMHGIDSDCVVMAKSGSAEVPSGTLVLISSIQTYRGGKLPKMDIVLVDEAHRIRARSYQDVTDNYQHGQVIGLTATPVRLDNVGFTHVFDEMIVATTYRYLHRRGLIVFPTCYSPEGLISDLSGVRILAGDYNSEDLEKVIEGEKLAGDAVEHYKKHGRKQKAIGFAISRKSARLFSGRFNRIGIPSDYIDGKMSLAEQTTRLKLLEMGKIRVLWSVDLANEGINIPSIRVVIMCRPTASYVIYQQQAGRGMRKGPRATIIDLVGNVIRHGFPFIDRDWSLDGKLPEVPEKDENKRCPNCDAVCPLLSEECPECGHEFPKHVRREVLGEVDLKLQRLMHSTFIRRLRKRAKEKGVGEEWVQKMMQARRESGRAENSP